MRETISRILNSAKGEGLLCLLIGGNSLAFYGYPRNTLDIDLLIPEKSASGWEQLLARFGYEKFHATGAFSQFKAEAMIPIDLMLVDSSTWDSLRPMAREFSLDEEPLSVPAPEHIIALKLHSANSPYRSRPEQDWEDIRALVRIQKLDPYQDGFKELILRYGGEVSLERVRQYWDERA